MTRLCLNMIVRNESERIFRCLESVIPHIHHYAVVDTGSTDNTAELIIGFMNEHGIHGGVKHSHFENFEQARNEALDYAREYAKHCDYFLLMDADMQLVVEDKDAFKGLTGPAYDMIQKAGTLSYHNRRLLHKNMLNVKYRGVTHEYLDVPSAGLVKGAHFLDHADGSNRVEKYKRDIKLLLEGLEKEPNNERYFFYLAQSYRDAGDPAKAAEWYLRRVHAGGWEEESWNAQVNYAHCLKDMGDEAGFIKALLEAYNMRPSRAEAIYDLAKHYREKGKNGPAALLSEAMLDAEYPSDGLFVNDYVYKMGFREEFSISGFYLPAKRKKAFKVTNSIAVGKSEYSWAKETAKYNFFHYVQPLRDMIPVTSQQIVFNAPVGYVEMNPSITNHGSQLWVNVRTVNYKITADGRYAIQGPDDTINDSNPINTRNFMLRLGHDLTPEVTKEVLPYGNEPKFKLVTGFEDMRIFSMNGDIWSSSCVRDMNEEGYCEQVLARLSERGHAMEITSMRRMLHEPRTYEKNWMPVSFKHHVKFMYRLNTVVDDHGRTQEKHDVPFDIDNISGGSQLLPFNGGFLAVVHEARVRPDNNQRYYYHRFAIFTSDLRLISLSLPFVFNGKDIEFAAGLAWHPSQHRKKLIISYGVKDKEAWLATVDATDILGLFPA